MFDVPYPLLIVIYTTGMPQLKNMDSCTLKPCDSMAVKNASIKSAYCGMECTPYSNLFTWKNEVWLSGAVLLQKLIVVQPVEKLLVHRVGFVVFKVEPWRFFSEDSCFSLSVLFHQCCILHSFSNSFVYSFVRLSPTPCNLTDWRRC